MIDEYFLRRPYKGDGSYKLADGSVNPKGGPRDGMIRTKADLDWGYKPNHQVHFYKPGG